MLGAPEDFPSQPIYASILKIKLAKTNLVVHQAVFLHHQCHNIRDHSALRSRHVDLNRKSVRNLVFGQLQRLQLLSKTQLLLFSCRLGQLICQQCNRHRHGLDSACHQAIVTFRLNYIIYYILF